MVVATARDALALLAAGAAPAELLAVATTRRAQLDQLRAEPPPWLPSMTITELRERPWLRELLTQEDPMEPSDSHMTPRPQKSASKGAWIDYADGLEAELASAMRALEDGAATIEGATATIEELGRLQARVADLEALAAQRGRELHRLKGGAS